MPHHIMSINDSNHVQIGGRKSKLAVVQSEIVKKVIEDTFPNLSCSILALSTLGDKVQTNHYILLVVNHCGQKNWKFYY